MSDARTTELPSAGEVPPRPDLPSAHDALEEPEEPTSTDREDEMDRDEQRGHPVIQPFEPIQTHDAADIDAESAPPPVVEPVPPPVEQAASNDEPEPKRRWRRKRKQPQLEPAAEVPLEQGRAESVPGPRGMFEQEVDAQPAATEEPPPPPATIDAPAPMTRPDAAPITPFAHETAPSADVDPEPHEPRGPVIVPTPGRYRLPDDFAFGPGAKPPRAKRGT